MEINYIGEQLIWGRIGNGLIVVAFASALLSVFSFLFGLFSREETNTVAWRKLARNTFFIHGAAVIGVIGLIFFLIQQHRFEYYYVWQHSSMILPIKYMWACFWEGQEGSFLLWTFWNIFLGTILIRKSKEWELPVMGIVMMVQVFLCSMVLGLQFGDVKIGSNPFILLRNQADFANLPFVQIPDYLSKIKDGRGLNPLLQNYWMVIHPPTLFLGFSSTLIPFAFAMGGLLKRDATGWVKPALPWTLKHCACQTMPKRPMAPRWTKCGRTGCTACCDMLRARVNVHPVGDDTARQRCPGSNGHLVPQDGVAQLGLGRDVAAAATIKRPAFDWAICTTPAGVGCSLNQARS